MSGSSGRRVYRDEPERGISRIVMSAAVPTCAAVGRCTAALGRPLVGWSGSQDMGVSVAKQTAGLLTSIRTWPVLLTQPNGSAATVSAQSTRVASRRFRANVASPFFAAVRSNLTAVNAGGALRRLPPSSVKSSRLPTACVHRLTHPR